VDSLLKQLEVETGTKPEGIKSLQDVVEAVKRSGKVVKFVFDSISNIEEIKDSVAKHTEQVEFVDSGLLKALFNSNFCEKDEDDDGKEIVQEIDFYEIEYSGKTFAKNKEGETESLDYENWDIVQLNDKNLIFMAGGDRQMPSYVKLGVTKGEYLKVIECISSQDQPKHEYTSLKSIDEDEIVKMINNR